MKFFKPLKISIFLILTVVTVGHGTQFNEKDTPGREKLNIFLTQLQSINSIGKKKIIINNDETTMDEFFSKLFNGNKPSNGKWAITDENVHRQAYFLHNLVSCEYSENIQAFTQLIDKAKTVINEKYLSLDLKNVQTNYYKPLQPILSSMIFTLLGLQKYTNNFGTMKLGILSALLSWYAYVKFVVEMNTNISDRNVNKELLIMKMTNYQVERYFKQFMLNNCQKNFNLKTHVVNDLGKDGNINSIKQAFDKTCTDMNSLFYFFDNTNESLIFVDKKEYMAPIITVIENQLPTTKYIRIKWSDERRNKEILEMLYLGYVSYSMDISTMLKFEKIFLQTITEIINGFVWKIFEDILTKEKPDESEYHTRCRNVVAILDKYIKKFKNDGQPSYLINNMSIIRTDLWNECFKFEIIDNISGLKVYINELNKVSINIFVEGNITNLEKFLEPLSKKAICAKVHPTVSNAFWDKFYFKSTNISEYVTDFKYFFKTYGDKNNEILCWKISDLSRTLKASPIKDQIELCKNIITQKGDVNDCFDKLKSLYEDFKKKIIDISVTSIETKLKDFDYKWKKILAILVYNQDKYSSNENNNEQTMNILYKLQEQIDDYFEVGSYLTCNLNTDVSTLNSNIYNWTFSDVLSKVPNFFVDIDSYKDFFKTINEYVVHIQTNSSVINNVKLFWDGSWMTPSEIHKIIYTNVEVDFLHKNNYDYLRFFIRWVLGALYSRMLDFVIHLDEYAETNKDEEKKIMVWYKTEVESLEKKFGDFMTLPLYTTMPVKGILDTYFSVLTKFEKYRTEFNNIKSQREVLQSLLDGLGVIKNGLNDVKDQTDDVKTDDVKNQTSQGKEYKDNETYVVLKKLIDTLDFLTDNFESYKLNIQKAANIIGIDQNYFAMLSREYKHEVK